MLTPPRSETAHGPTCLLAPRKLILDAEMGTDRETRAESRRRSPQLGGGLRGGYGLHHAPSPPCVFVPPLWMADTASFGWGRVIAHAVISVK